MFLANGLRRTATSRVQDIQLAEPDQGTQQLHAIATRAVKRGRFEDACECYELIARCEFERGDEQSVGRAFLLLALTQQRRGETELARRAFQRGIALHRTDARLMQAWGLFESKHGSMSRALRLLRRAVALDPSLSPVLEWHIFRPPATATGGLDVDAGGLVDRRDPLDHPGGKSFYVD